MLTDKHVIVRWATQQLTLLFASIQNIDDSSRTLSIPDERNTNCILCLLVSQLNVSFVNFRAHQIVSRGFDYFIVEMSLLLWEIIFLF